MRIPLDRSGVVPLWRQIERFIRAEIESGALPAGTRIPSSRALATALRVSRITVDNAYLSLATDGLVVASPGRGTFVASIGPPRPLAEPAHWPVWQQAMTAGAASTDAADVEPPPDVISFTGVGDPRLFPTREIALTIGDVIRADGADAFTYGDGANGHRPLRQTVTHLLASQGVHTTPDRVVITSGSQQALFLACSALLQPGDTVVAEQPTYDHALALFDALGVGVVGVDVDTDGMDVDGLEATVIEHGPKLIYTIPTFQNPTGASLSTARRQRLVDLARAHDIPIVEDDFVGDLRYEGRAQAPLKALDERGDVLYIGSFSKMLMPGIRVGYLVGDGPIVDRVSALKRATDLSTSNLMQRVLDRYLTVGRYQTHLRRSIRSYRQRRDAMVAALGRHTPDIALTAPAGGLFLWATLPDGVGATALRAAAMRRGVDVTPGTRFYADPSLGERNVRLNFAARDEQQIDTGVARLARAIADLR
ncbi:PLP-dependent aminotransferase family protein [Desertimonas flava]|uniref:MocR-like pyridoxine biosynthesis transcription factor PdxR n=1 Tax=Desertimonas flava TaxID=2064846 RepID=UPI000E353AAD|nr:PLP-dependent aminotransferase family protein [Desertimonas flava]